MNSERLREQLVEELSEVFAALAEYEAVNPSAWSEVRTRDALRELQRIATAGGIELTEILEKLNKDHTPL